MLAEVGIPADDAAPGAARMVIVHCLAALVAHRVARDAELLGSELVTNSGAILHCWAKGRVSSYEALALSGT